MRTANFFVPLPRHPLLRALLAIAGAVLLAGLVATGLLVGAVVATAATLAMLVRRWLRGRAGEPADPDIIEGEFTVVPKRPPTALPRTE